MMQGLHPRTQEGAAESGATTRSTGGEGNGDELSEFSGFLGQLKLSLILSCEWGEFGGGGRRERWRGLGFDLRLRWGKLEGRGEWLRG
jgi:hypothetical protein